MRKRAKANPVSARKTAVILWSLVKKNTKNQYRRSALGVLWTVLNPLLNMLVMAFVFSRIFGRTGTGMDYPVYVLSGNVVFGFMRAATLGAMPSLVSGYDLITKTRTPYAVFPLSFVLTALVNFGFSLVALVVVMAARIFFGASGVGFYWTGLLVIFPWLPAFFLFAVGLALLLSVLYVRFRDLKHIYNVFLTLWMYLTPIFYSVEMLRLPDSYGMVLKLNPMYHYLLCFRQMIGGTVPGGKELLLISAIGLVTFGIGTLLFRILKKKIIFYI